MNDKPNNPKYYRLLEKGEIINPGDLSIMNGDWKTLDAGNYVVGQDYKDSVMKILRPVQVDEWIEYAKQKPTKEDYPLNTLLPDGRIGFANICYNDSSPFPLTTTESNFQISDDRSITHWRRVTPPQPAKPKSVTVSLKDDGGMGRQAITVHADGHASTPCGSYFSAESIDAFIKARLEVTKKDL